MPHLTPPTIRQLALIKYMFQEGEQQSRRPSPLFVTALTAFQDAAELFLHLACGHHQANLPKRPEFFDYFSALKTFGPVRHQQDMARLNTARVNFKHHGNLPNNDDMEFFRVTARNFFEENAPLLFGVAFAEISLVDLVACAKAKEPLKKAQEQWAESCRRDSEASVALAFDALLADYRSRKRVGGIGRSLFSFGPSLRHLSGFFMGVPHGKLRDFFDATAESIEGLRDAVEILAFGLDYRKFVRFDLLTPSVSHTAAGTHIVGMRSGSDWSDEEFEFCFSFVIESAVKLQEFDFTLAAPPARVPPNPI